ncbi:MAG: N-6 DNA methylase, partial [Methylococcales bacterium]
MITKDNFKNLLLCLDFSQHNNQFSKQLNNTHLAVDFDKQILVYPDDLIINEHQTCNFSAAENFVVFECVHRLLEKGYKPEHIELEPKWQVGHGASGGRADILIKDNEGNVLLIIECKTAGNEFKKAWNNTLEDGGQLFGYAANAAPDFLSLYASDFDEKLNIIKPTYYLISLKDNDDYLKENAHKELASFSKSKKTRESLFSIWKETYNQEPITKGIFEPSVQSYHIGKQKVYLEDLQTLIGADIQAKYHEFATVLRQHNISGRENAFDKLINLFLCKIVDEAQNSQKDTEDQELKFYWKGIGYDSYFDLIDRLQQLYQVGMKRFLNEDVTYIKDDDIDNAFRYFKNDPDATRTTIEGIFKQLKYFTNSDFAFLDVHNESLFYQNSVVLLKIVQMLQDIRLLQKDQHNQFLGDLFEGFLDNGIKQSEGQFFTPMPICRFILQSLPLESLFANSAEPPKAIDYACGAGHFLNELAMQITPFVKQHQHNNAHDYYAQFYGIEKEYRLSKVAKVSAFMYGQDDI